MSITAQYTGMGYLEQQPGGLSDELFLTKIQGRQQKQETGLGVNWNLMAVMADYTITKNLKFNTRFFVALLQNALH